MKYPSKSGKKTPSCPKSTRNPARILMAAGVMSGILLTQANAATITWAATGTIGDMGVTGSWSPNATIAGATNAYVFAGTTAAATANNTATSATATSITFSSGAGAYTLTGNTLGFTGNLINNSTNLQTIGLSLALSGNISIQANSGAIEVDGAISGSGKTLSTSGGNLVKLTGSNTQSGATTVGSGTLQLSGSGSIASTSGITVNSGGVLLLDDRGSVAINKRTSGGITIAGGGQMVYQGSDQAGVNSTQTVGTIGFGTNGMSILTANYNGTNTATLTTGTLSRTVGKGVMLINGANLGTGAASSAATVVYANSSYSPTLIGTAPSTTTGINASAQNTKIVPYLLGESGTATGANGTATGVANTFLTYNTVTGFRPLNPTDEFTNNSIVVGNNTYITAATTSSSTAAINSLVINGGDLTIADGTTLTNSSGALLFVTNNTIGGTGLLQLASGSQEGIIMVNAGVSGTIGAGLLLTGTTTVDSMGALTLSGANTGSGTLLVTTGTVTMTGSSAFSGTTLINTGATVVVGSDSALGNSTVSTTSGSGVLATDGQVRTLSSNIAVTSSTLTLRGSYIFNGSITGNGSLALTGGTTVINSANTYSGSTVLTGGTVVIGNNNAFGTSTVYSGGIMGDGQARTIANQLSLSSAGSITIAGSSELTLTGLVGMAQYAAVSLNVYNTALTTISGTVALTNSGSGTNNGALSLTLGSGANVKVTAPITDNSTGNTTVTTGQGGQFSIKFVGVGANATIAPTAANNGFGTASGTGTAGSAAIIVTAPAYNTVTIGGPGGAGATITPFGGSYLSLNNGGGLTAFLQAATDGQFLGNNIYGGGSSAGFGFAGTNGLTLSGSYSIGSVSGVTFTNISTGTGWTFNNTVTLNTQNATTSALTIAGWGTTVFSSSSSLVSSAAGKGGLVKLGSGVLQLSGTVTANGLTKFDGGTVVLDYGSTSAGAGTSNMSRLTASTSGTGLILNGVNLQLSGGNFSQTVATGTSSFGVGNTTISQINGGTSTINLGVVTRLNGSTANFASGVASTSSVGTNGILGGWAVVNGSDWAVGGGSITALGAGSYATVGSSIAAASDTNNSYLTDGATVTGSTGWTTNSLKIATTGGGNSLNLNGNSLVLRSGGILFTGANDYTISGGSIKNSNSGGDVVINQYGTGALIITGTLPDNATSSLTKTGSGVLELDGVNGYKNGTYLNGGTIRVNNDSSLGGTGSNLFINGGTLELMSDGFTTSRIVSVGSNGGTLQVDAGTATFNGNISGSSYGAFNKTGDGTLVFGGSFTNNGPINILSGTFQLASYNALGTSTSTNESTSPVTVSNGATLDIAGYTASAGNVTLISGNILDTVGDGSLNAYSYTLQSGTVGAIMGDLSVTGAVNSSINLYKTTAGTVVLTGTNTYSGLTSISAGTLQIGDGGNSGRLGLGSVSNSGNLAFDRSDTVTVSNAIYGSGSVTQMGTGKTILNGVNTYTGATNITSGELDVNSSLAAGSAVTVSGTLGGSGTVNGTTTVIGGAINGSGLKLVGAATFSGDSKVAGTNTFSNGISATSGTLSLTGLTTGAVTVDSSASFINGGTVTGNVDVNGKMSGSGTVVGTLGIHSGGTFAVSQDTVTGNLVVDSGAKISMALNSLTDYSKLTVSGNITLNGTLELTLGSIAVGDRFVLIDNTGSSLINTTFSSIVFGGQSLLLSSSNTFTVNNMVYDISYGSAAGDDVVLTALAAVPEPSTWAMVVGGMGMLIGFGRTFRRRQG